MRATLSWAFAIPRPSVTHTAAPPPPPFIAAAGQEGRWEVLVELHLDSGIKRYSQTGINSGSKFWEPRIHSIGSIQREISILPKDYRVSDDLYRS